MKLLLALLLGAISQLTWASPSSDLQKIMRPSPASSKTQGVDAYVFVSTAMLDGQLINIARQAKNYGFVIVLNGPGADEDQTKLRITQINDACCGNAVPTWIVYPQLFRAFKVVQTPSFVIAKGESGQPDTFSLVAGGMSIPDALGLFSNKSKLQFVKAAASNIYKGNLKTIDINR